MNAINLYCKANKRKRDDKAIGAYAYILKDENGYKEEVYILDGEMRVGRLELLALVSALKDLEMQNKLNGENQVNLYVSNEYILEELIKGIEDQLAGKTLNFSKGTEYIDLWQEVENLLDKCQGYTVTGLNKKDRGECEEEIKRSMGALNKIVCDRINSCLREIEG